MAKLLRNDMFAQHIPNEDKKIPNCLRDIMCYPSYDRCVSAGCQFMKDYRNKKGVFQVKCSYEKKEKEL